MRSCISCGKDNQTNSRFCHWCGTALNGATLTGLLPSQSLLHSDRYLIIERIGKGGMGAVYKALDLQLRKRIVAIKEMSQNGLVGVDLSDAISAFTREAEILAHLKHQSLPSIYGQFEEGGRRYLVMEFIDGETLEERLEKIQKQGQRISRDKMLEIGMKLCDVLHYLHSQYPPIVFRDLKPSNIMLSTHGEVYLIDFGIARLLVPGQAKDTVALGSQGYAPPEQYKRLASPRSDIYSLGATLHQMLTGDDPSNNPFVFRPLSTNIPALERLVTTMLALDEKQRPTSMYEVRRSLASIAQTQPSGKTKGRASHSAATATTTSMPVTVYAVASSSGSDQKLWQSVQDQLLSLIDGFPRVSIKEGLRPGEDPFTGRHRAVDEANLILLLLSEDFLSSPDCIAAANRAIDRYEARQGAEVLAVLLRPCSLRGSRVALVRSVPEDAIAHLSLYAQEQRILEVAKTIRKLLVPLLMGGKKAGPMNLLQWLLWQLYGNGRTICPHFTVGRYVLKSMRASGLAGILIHLFDQQKDRVLHEYLIGPIRCSDLTHLLQVIAPSLTDPERVQGIATHSKP